MTESKVTNAPCQEARVCLKCGRTENEWSEFDEQTMREMASVHAEVFAFLEPSEEGAAPAAWDYKCPICGTEVVSGEDQFADAWICPKCITEVRKPKSASLVPAETPK